MDFVSFVVKVGITFSSAGFFGNVAWLWWGRVHGSTLPRRGAAWLAVCIPYLLFGLALVGAGLSRLTSEISLSASFGALDPVHVSVVFAWLWFMGAARDLWDRLLGFGLLVVPGLAAVAVFAAASGHEVLAPLPSRPDGIDFRGSFLLLLWLTLNFVMLARKLPELHVPEPEADFDGGFRFALVTRTAEVSLVLAILSAVLVVPGLVLAMFPALRGGRAVTVSVMGEAVEIREPGKVTRLLMQGGTVSRTEDWFGWEVLVLVSPTETVRLGVGGVPRNLVDALVTRLEEATRAVEVPAPVPVPQALRTLRHQLA